jgi:hypothetical protein
MSASRMVRPARPLRWAVWSGAAGLLFSGLLLKPAWLGLDPASAEAESLRAWAAPAHAALAGLGLMVVGGLAGHVAQAWRAGRSRPWGVALLAVLAGLCLSAWALYYAGPGWREGAAAWHLALGLGLLPALLWHAWRGRRKGA